MILVSRRLFKLIKHFPRCGGLLLLLPLLLISGQVFPVPQHSGSEQGVIVLVTRMDDLYPEVNSLTSSILLWFERVYMDYPTVEVKFLDVSLPADDNTLIAFLESMPVGSFAVFYGHCAIDDQAQCNLSYEVIVNGGSADREAPLAGTSADFMLELSGLASPEVPDIVFLLGYSALISVYYERGEISAAGRTCSQALGNTGGVPPEYLSEIESLRTDILNERDNLNTIVILSDSIELEPDNGDLYLERALINAQLGLFTESIEDLDMAIMLGPVEDDSYAAYGGGILELTSRMRHAYNDGVHIDPGISGSMEERLDDALLYLNRAVELNPDSAEIYFMRAGVYGYKTEWPSSVEDLSTAIELNPNYGQAYLRRGNINLEMGFSEEAISDLSRAIELNPDSVSYYEYRAFAYQNCGDVENARIDLQTVSEMRGE